MRHELAFVGDVHGNLLALQGMWAALVQRDVRHVIFLGDYINKGAQSADVMSELIRYAGAGHATLLAGNHEIALLDALDRQDLSAFLKMGGAATIRSYVGGRVGPDVLEEFTNRIPSEHLNALRRMSLVYDAEDLLAQHAPPKSPTRRFCISAHAPVGDLPRVGRHSAQLDTGCGSEFGRLTALLWPVLDYVQVNAQGALLAR